MFAPHLVERFSASGGRGVRAVVDGLPVVVGRASCVLEQTAPPEAASRPEEKATEVARLRAAGHVVAMLGDGVNDAPALAAADLGMAMGSDADVAMEVADVTLVRADPMLAATAVRLSRATLRIIHENSFWAFAYNIARIPLAAAGMLSPMIAGLAMAASSVLVVGNSLRLARFERRPNLTS